MISPCGSTQLIPIISKTEKAKNSAAPAGRGFSLQDLPLRIYAVNRQFNTVNSMNSSIVEKYFGRNFKEIFKPLSHFQSNFPFT